jgi:hypothetical protein
MKSGRQAPERAWVTLELEADWVAQVLSRGERQLGREECDPAEAERDRRAGRALPDRSPDRRN